MDEYLIDFLYEGVTYSAKDLMDRWLACWMDGWIDCRKIASWKVGWIDGLLAETPRGITLED